MMREASLRLSRTGDARLALKSGLGTCGRGEGGSDVVNTVPYHIEIHDVVVSLSKRLHIGEVSRASIHSVLERLFHGCEPFLSFGEFPVQLAAIRSQGGDVARDI